MLHFVVGLCVQLCVSFSFSLSLLKQSLTVLSVLLSLNLICILGSPLTCCPLPQFSE